MKTSTPKKKVAAQPAEQKTSISLPRDLWVRAKVRAAENGTDLRSVVIDALTAFLK